MKIIFICGCLEPGRDGVGDYTRRLSAELIKLGHTVGAVSLNDKFISSNIKNEQHFEGVNLPVLRLASCLTLKARLEKIKGWIQIFRPELISLQYVPYSYQNNGIPLYLASFLTKLQSGARWEIMIHEPFLAGYTSLKMKLITLLQKFSLKLIKAKLKPVVFHTSIPQYQKLLLQVGIQSKLLGLFGNIHIETIDKEQDSEGINLRKMITGLYFGSAPSPTHYSLFTDKIKSFNLESKALLRIIICGKSGSNGESFVRNIKSACKDLNCEISVLGELEPKELSKLFLEADFGISRVPPRYIGKSGSSISMLEHGLPLWLPILTQGTIEESLDFRPELCFHELNAILTTVKKKAPLNRLPVTAATFLKDVQIQ